MVRPCTLNAEGIVSILIRELRSRMPHSLAKKEFGIKGGEGHGHSGYLFPAIKRRFETGNNEEKWTWIKRLNDPNSALGSQLFAQHHLVPWCGCGPE